MTPLTELDQLDDARLMQRVAGGDPAALEVLYRRYAGPIMGLAYKMLNDRASAEEVVQETFWRVWRKGHSFRRHRGKFTTWMFGITRNLCIDTWRKRQTRPKAIPHREDTLRHDGLVHSDTNGNGHRNGHRTVATDDRANPEECAWAAIRGQQLRIAVTRLPDGQREVIEMAFFREMTHQQIADSTGVPLGTVHTRARLGLQKLRRSLANKGFEA